MVLHGGGGMGGGGSSAPTNQDEVMGSSNKISRGGQSVSISSAGDSNYRVWFAPTGTSTFTEGGTMTSTEGTSMNIDAPNDEGTYYIYVRNSSGQTSNQSSASLQVDNTAPDTQNNVLSSNQTVKSMTSVTIGSSGDFNNQVWLAGNGTESFIEGDMMTKASSGTSTSILSPNTEGTYYAYVIDQAGNVSNPSSSTLTVDDTAPTNQDTVFPNSVSKKSGVSVSINSSGDASNEVWFAPNGTTSFSETNSNMSKANNGDSIEINTPTDEGSYNLYIIDPAGNRSDGSMAVLTVDNTAPTNQDTVFPNSTSSFAGGNVSINSSGDQTNEVWFAPSGTSIFLEGPTMTKAMNGISTTINAPTNDQNYYLYIIDQAGNVSNASIAVLTIDNNPPDAPSVVFPVGDTTTNTVTVTLASDATSYEYSISDAANGTVGAYNPGSGTSFTLSDRTYAIDDVKVRNKDAAGNISQSTNNTSQFTVDTTPPGAPSVSFPSGTTNNNSVDVTLATGASGFQFSTNSGDNFSVGTLTVNAMGGISNTGTFTLIDGTYAIDQIQIKNTDAAGNVSTTTNNSSQIIIDTVIPGPPTVTFPSAGTGNVTNVSVTLSSGATNYTYSTDAGVSFTNGTYAGMPYGFTLTNGTYNIDQIQVKNGDNAGNESSSINNSYQIIINTTAPDPPTVSFPSGTTNTNSVSVTLATDAVSYEFSIDSGVNFSSGTGTSFTLSDATYNINQIRVRNVDAAGNISGTTNNDNQIVIDTVAPDPPTVSSNTSSKINT